MANGVDIPGRTILPGATVFTDWVSRGGDCFIVRAEAVEVNGGGEVTITAWTRGEDGSSITQVTVTDADITLNNSDRFGTALYLAEAASGGAQEEIRLKIVHNGGDPGEDVILRIFPIIFFDNGVEYTS